MLQPLFIKWGAIDCLSLGEMTDNLYVKEAATYEMIESGFTHCPTFWFFSCICFSHNDFPLLLKFDRASKLIIFMYCLKVYF